MRQRRKGKIDTDARTDDDARLTAGARRRYKQYAETKHGDAKAQATIAAID